MGTFFQVILNVIGGAITIALIELGKLWYDRSIQKKFKEIFGVDAFVAEQFHLVYAHLALISVVDQGGNQIRHPYVKPGEETSGTGYSIERPVSSCEVRAAKYLAASVGKYAKVSPVLSSDIETKGKLDVSFIALGGPLSNYKTRDVITNGANNLIKCNNMSFTSAKSGKPVVTFEPGFDYGLILKIHPSQFPNRIWFTCAGLGEWGTSGAAWYLANKWIEIQSFAGNNPFAIVVRVKRDQDEFAEPVYQLKT